MRKIGIKEIEDIALGASLLGAGGGGSIILPEKLAGADKVLMPEHFGFCPGPCLYYREQRYILLSAISRSS